MNEKYFCLVCGNRFNEANRSENTGGYYCPKCGHDKLLHETLKSKPFSPALLNWLNPWIPKAEQLPPDGHTVDCKRMGNIRQPLYYDNEFGEWFDKHDELYADVTHWRELPPMPEVTR